MLLKEFHTIFLSLFPAAGKVTKRAAAAEKLLIPI